MSEEKRWDEEPEGITGQRREEEAYLKETLLTIKTNIKNYQGQTSKMQEEIDEMLDHYHDNDVELYTALNNTITMQENMKRALLRNRKALKKPYFGRIVFHDESLDKEESLYIGRGGISKDATHQMVIDWRAPVANAYYENGLGKCSYPAPDGGTFPIDLKLKRTYEIEDGKLLDYFDTEVIANDDLLTKYLAKNKQAVLGEIIATIQKEQNDIIRKSPYHNMIVQGVAGSGKTTVAMHRISYILYNYQERFKPDDFYIVGSNRILLEYITGVLPDLDVYGIRQMTMEQLFVRLLYEDWDEKKHQIKENTAMGKNGNIRGTYSWFRDLEAYCKELEKNTISTETVYLNPKQFVEGFRDGKTGVFDETEGKPVNPKDLVTIMQGEDVANYVAQNPAMSIQTKINMLNERLIVKLKDEFLKKRISYTKEERKTILKAYRGRYGKNVWKQSIYEIYNDFLRKQFEKGYEVEIPENEFDVYDLAALAYLYKRVKETEVISEAHHIVIDEAQDFGMMAYAVLHFCIKDCTYTIMGDVSQNIHFGYGLNDWEELRSLMLVSERASFGVLKKSYRNTVEISEFAMNVLYHGRFAAYPAEPIIRHGNPVSVKECRGRREMIKKAAQICKEWQSKGLDTIAVICRNEKDAKRAVRDLSELIEVAESDLTTAVYVSGVMVLPVAYTKGLEFDAVLILDPDNEDYPVDDGHAKLLYVAATRALHELCVLHIGDLTGLIADPLPEEKRLMLTETAAASQMKEKGEAAAESLKETEETNKSTGYGDFTEQNCTAEQKDIIKKNNAVEKSNAAKTESNHVQEKKVTAQGTVTEKENMAVKRPVAATGTAVRKKVVATVKTPKTVAPPSQTVLLTGVHPSVRAKVEIKKPASRLDMMLAGSSRSYEADSKRTTRRNGGALRRETRPEFGDMPSAEALNPGGYAKQDHAVKWICRESDGLYLQSRAGVLRLSPISSNIIRVTFAGKGNPKEEAHEKIALRKTEKAWMYKETFSGVELSTDELILQVDKKTGAVSYMDRKRQLLLAEKGTGGRRIQEGTGGEGKAWLFPDWKKDQLYSPGADGKEGLKLNGKAYYISATADGKELPFVLSDKGYGILVASDSSVICCDIKAYGSYLSAEESQLDFYFITGKKQKDILDAYGRLCGL